MPLPPILCQKLCNHLGIGLGNESRALSDQRFLDLGKVLDDSIMDNGNAINKMRMRIGFIWHAMRRPAGMRNPDITWQRLSRQPCLQIEKLPLCAAAVKLTVVDRCNAG